VCPDESARGLPFDARRNHKRQRAFIANDTGVLHAESLEHSSAAGEWNRVVRFDPRFEFNVDAPVRALNPHVPSSESPALCPASPACLFVFPSDCHECLFIN